MRIMVEIGHPGHVHQFKNMIWNLEDRGHDVKIATIDKDVAKKLLNSYDFKYENLGINYENLHSKFYGVFKNDFKLFRLAMKFKPDLFNPNICGVCGLSKRAKCHQ